MPTGTALRDARDQLFDAAERILLTGGVSALTSRAVTTEAGVAKGVLHRHFTDFDDFLAAFVLDRAARIASWTDPLLARAGTATVVANLAAVATDLFATIARSVLGLVIARDALRHRLRAATGPGIPVLREATALVRAYLAAERDLGRIAPDADLDTLAPLTLGAVHLVLTDDRPAGPAALEPTLRAALATALT